jgi:hypothetical protein
MLNIHDKNENWSKWTVFSGIVQLLISIQNPSHIARFPSRIGVDELAKQIQ